ncbi:hypothetical protein THF1C08_300035 [Vibrio jasicida]|uniref:Uncharacterized protein n=1 Tax=Vibrio jasicida TaxID=766224 RepID=A0AAU9QPI6_9VIBR|nr:hypothetical protein THF1C08_300035 [Vibrio jasicida]CAH1594647.1 hypothetical protein THF1A12_290036 [Vibrio jasicida]
MVTQGGLYETDTIVASSSTLVCQPSASEHRLGIACKRCDWSCPE